LNRNSDATKSVTSSPDVVGGALPEALDDSENSAALLFARICTEDERLGSSEELASSNLANSALKSEGDLLGLLRLLSEDGLGLTTEPRLLSSVASSTLGLFRVLALLVLRNLEFLVLLAVPAVSHFGLGSMHLHHERNELTDHSPVFANDRVLELTIIAAY